VLRQGRPITDLRLYRSTLKRRLGRHGTQTMLRCGCCHQCRVVSMRNANAAVQVSANSRARSLPPSVDAAGREAWLTFVVVVDGPTGVELAGALSELAHTGLESDYRAINPATARVILVQSAPWILPAFSSALSARAERSLRDLGVDVRTGAKVTDIDEDAMAIDGIHIPARTTIWAAGVAASSAAKWLGPRINSNRSAGASVPGLAPAAKQQDRYVANVIRAAIEGHPAPGAFQAATMAISRPSDASHRLWNCVGFGYGARPLGGFGPPPTCSFPPADAIAPPSC
jgi:NADH dehydrogenase FAD-containing subunit